MGTTWFVVVGILIAVFQASVSVGAEEPACVPGFESDNFIFKVARKQLRKGRRLGRVGFTDCTDRTRFLFRSDDSRFSLQTDGILSVNRPVALHEGHLDFFIHSWDSQGRKMTVPVTVMYLRHHNGNHHGDHHEDHHEYHHGDHHRDHHGNHKHQQNEQHLTEVDSTSNTEIDKCLFWFSLRLVMA
ncbi:hypothetical protein INR49_023100 [Caranx melampygus]|nr:hypothetical protein INR49_023100 [Caranx melampygus]